MRSICPLSVPSSGEYVYVTAEPISLPYSRLLHPPDISLCPSTLLPPILFPLCVLCPSVSLSLPTSLPIALWLYQVWSQRPVRLAQRHCLSLSLSRTHTFYPCSRFPCLEVGPYRFTGRSVSIQVLLEGIPYLFRYYLRWWRSKKREGMFYIYICVYWSFFFSCYPVLTIEFVNLIEKL